MGDAASDRESKRSLRKLGVLAQYQLRAVAVYRVMGMGTDYEESEYSNCSGV